MYSFRGIFRDDPRSRFVLALLLSLVLHALIAYRLTSLGPENLVSARQSNVLHVNLAGAGNFLRAPEVVHVDPSVLFEAGLPPGESRAPVEKIKVTPKASGATEAEAARPSVTRAGEAANAGVPAGPSARLADSLLVPYVSRDAGELRHVPSRVDAVFDVYEGTERRFSASLQNHFELSRQGFRLQVRGVPDPSASEGSAGEIEISGALTAYGLRPQFQKTDGDLQESLVFGGGVAPSQNRSKVRREFNTDGTLDRYSLLFQFLAHPPKPEGGHISIAYGNSFEAYNYRVVGKEVFNSPAFGEVLSLRLQLISREGQETIDMWLLAEREYLPLKVRYSDKNGKIIEIMAKSMTSK